MTTADTVKARRPAKKITSRKSSIRGADAASTRGAQSTGPGDAERTGPMTAFTRAWQFADYFAADPIQRIEIAKRGIPAQTPGDVAARMGLTKDRMYSILGLPRATVERKVRERKVLTPEESLRVIGIGRLVGQAQKMVQESGNAQDFDAGKWVASWIESPVPALGGRKPAELMDTSEGQAIVANLLSRAQSGAYS